MDRACTSSLTVLDMRTASRSQAWSSSKFKFESSFKNIKINLRGNRAGPGKVQAQLENQSTSFALWPDYSHAPVEVSIL